MNPEAIDLDTDLPADSEEEYQSLVRTLDWTTGFGLTFVRCSPAAGEELIVQIRNDIPDKKIEVLRLEQAIDNLYPIIENLPNRDQVDILFVTGLEKSFVESIKPGYGGQGDYYKLDTVPRILGHLNLQRERFRDNFNICFVFILPLFGLKYFIHRAPDFFDWRSGVFEFSTKQEVLEQESARIIQEGDYKKYCSLSPEAWIQKVLEIQELLNENQKPNDRASLQLELGNLLVAAQKYEAALASYDKFLEFQPDLHHTWYLRGTVLQELGRFEEAVASYDKFLEFQPDNHVAWNNRGFALGNLGRYEEAVASYDQALKIQPDNHTAWNIRGVALENLEQFEEAVASYDRALKIQPDNHAAWNSRGIALWSLRRYEEAVASYDKSLKIQPDNHQTWNIRGIALDDLGRFEEAVACFDKSLKIQPNDHQTWNIRGNALRNLGRYEEAVASYDKALEIQPDDSITFYYKACIYALQGNLDQAIENLQQAINLSPEKCREWAKTDSDFDKIREDERFQALIQAS